MISEVVMPQMGADMTEGTIVRWLKGEGEDVKRGDVIAEIETDKANVEIEAFESGVFRKTLASEGDVVSVGDVIAVIAGADDDISRYGDDAAPSSAKAAPSTAAPSAAAPAAVAPPKGEQTPPDARPASVGPAAPASPPRGNGRLRASPLARRLAQERGLDLAALSGSGPGGRITRKDVEAAQSGQKASATPATAPPARALGQPQQDDSHIVTPTRMRQAIARRMSLSKREAPHYYVTVDVDMTEAASLRKEINESLDDAHRVSVNDLVVRACVLALKRHPQFNATIQANEIREYGEQHVCIGIALDDGLVAPAIIGAGAMSLVEVAAASKDLAERTRNGRLRADEMSAGTFTISNLGAYGVDTLIAIIQPPQTAILGVGAASARAVVRDGAVVVRDVMTVALSADHRVTDGAQGAEFLAEVKRVLEQPLLLLL